MPAPWCVKKSSSDFLASGLDHRKGVMHCWSILSVCLVTVGLTGARADPPKPDVNKLMAVLVKAFNDASGKELHPLCSAEFQKQLAVARLTAVLREGRYKYGTLPDSLGEPKVQGSRRVYRIHGPRLDWLLTVVTDSAGKLAGLRFQPAFLANLPAGPLSLEEVQAHLQNAVEQTLYAYHVPSISLALVKDDRLVWAKAFGYENVAKAVPADPETVYVTGSIIKVVVATAVMQLVDEGKLDLDAPVNKYLKALQVPNTFEKEAPLTVRHLLSHHGGLPNGAQIVDVWSRELPLTLEEVIRKRVRAVTRPGAKFEYSNYAYTLNAYLVGQLTGMSFERAVKQRLLDPLGMTRTVFAPTPAIAENLALPYQTSGEVIEAAPRVRLDVWPAGDVYSTPSDLARFLLLHLNGGKVGGKQLLSVKSVAEMARLQFAKKDEKSGVGLGWMIESAGGRRVLWHNGAVPGFYTYMAIDPDKRLGIVLFSNKFNQLEAALGVMVDPLLDLRVLAFALLDRLKPFAAKS
jgi:CubicO group peptidase (beta-lactamase class C family)